MNGRRNKIIEDDLQSVLDEGGNVWAIGDVHGYAQTLVTLLHSLELTHKDRVVLLGDLVDRGPNSCEVIRIARENPQIYSILGNHEDMMLRSFDIDNIGMVTNQQKNWFYVGGRATNQSYIDEFTNANGDLEDFDLRMRVGRDLALARLTTTPHSSR